MNAKKIYILGLMFLMTAVTLTFASASAGNFGEHNGEKQFLNYSIEYLHPQVFEDFPLQGYFNVPGYNIRTVMPFLIRISNTGERTFENLRVVTVQEFFEGGVMPGQLWNEESSDGFFSNGANQTFFISKLEPEQTVELQGFFTIPVSRPGLDKTRLIIAHWNNANTPEDNDGDGSGFGRVIINDPFAGIFCPPA